MLKSHLFSSCDLIHVFTTRKGGLSRRPYCSLNMGYHVGDCPDTVRLNRERVARALGIPQSRWVFGEQVHGNRVKSIDHIPPPPGSIAGVDALVTDRPEIMLVAFFADCVPVYFYDPEKKVCALAHAGWRGTLEKIGLRTFRLMESQFGCRPESCLVFIGPAIGSCCYEIDEVVANPLAETFPGCWQDFTYIKKGKMHLDLKAVNAFQLKQAGIPEKQLEVSAICTSCSSDLFYSFRRNQGCTGRMAAIIGFKKKG